MSENMTDWKNLEFLLVILFDIVIIIFVVTQVNIEIINFFRISIE